MIHTRKFLSKYEIMHSIKFIRLLAFFFLLFCGLFLSVKAIAKEEPCNVGLRFAKNGDYFRAHYEWRLIADDASQKMWALTTSVCLKKGRLAKSDSAVVEWLKRAGEYGSSDGWIQAAILTINEIGICEGHAKAKFFLEQATKANNESAIFFTNKITEFRQESCTHNAK
jgi:hypothetical protein